MLRAVFPLFCGAVAASGAPRPNFLLLFVDDLGYNEVNLGEAKPATGGYTGYGGRVQTPAIAQLAAEGMVFTSWYSGWSLCSPSRAACLTGRLPPRTGIDSVGRLVLTAEAVGGLPVNETTFAEVLRPQGYRTGMIGKWHLGVRDRFLPHNRGFQSYFGVPYSVDMGTSVWMPNGTGWGYPLLPLPLIDATETAGSRIVEQPVALHTLSARYAARGAEFIEQSAAAGDPWMLFMSFNHVHDPQFCANVWCRTSNVTGVKDAVPSGHGGTGSAVQEVDWTVGRLLAALKTAGSDDETLVFFTSDNGAPANHVAVQDERGSNAPLSGFKGHILEGGIRMPAVARWPGKIRAGSVSHELVATYDMFTTMAALAEAPLPVGRIIDGIDLTPILLDRPGAPHGHSCLFQYYSGVMLAAVRCGKWKLRFDLDPVQLFDLEADIGERHPIPNTTAGWHAVVANISAARRAHLATVVPVQDQLALGSSPEFALCAAPRSVDVRPDLPNCTLTPANWVPPWQTAAPQAVAREHDSATTEAAYRDPCQYWLSEESNVGGYSTLNLSGTGLQPRRTIAVNGDDFGAGKTLPFPNGTLSHEPMTLQDFVGGFNRSFLELLVTRRMVPRINHGINSTNVIVLDLEFPFPWVHPCEYGTLNQSTLEAVVNATKLRISVIRDLFPRAGLGLYSTAGCTDPTAVAGYRKAAQLGLFDGLTHLVPVVYMGAKTVATKVAWDALNATRLIQPRDGRRLQILPLFTWLVSRKSGGRFYGCSLEIDRLHNEMAAVRQWDADQEAGQRVAAMVFWTPDDSGVSGPTKACGRNSPQLSYQDWLRRARIVPSDCPH